jgi:hypothetical protein
MNGCYPIPDNPYSNYEGLIIAPVAAAAGSYAVLAASSSIPIPVQEPMILGAGAQIIASATFDQYIKPLISM